MASTAAITGASAAGIAGTATPAQAVPVTHVQAPVLARELAVRQETVSRRTVTVASGDTLSGIAAAHCGTSADWPGIYNANRGTIRDPDLIYPRQVLTLNCASGHLAASGPPAGKATPHRWYHHYRWHHYTAPHRAVISHGIYSYSALEALWVSAGGSPRAEATAACIAEHESGGDPGATGKAGERGLWQIMPLHGALSTYSPSGNARGAVIISGNGTDWSPWTTHIYCGV